MIYLFCSLSIASYGCCLPNFRYEYLNVNTISYQFQARKEMGLDGSDASLENMILARQKSRDQQAESFLDGLAAKYGAKGSQKKKKK